jgi:hypothetical protein
MAEEINFKSHMDIRNWFKQQSRDVMVVFAARAALRVLPVFASLPGFEDPENTHAKVIILPVFRAMATALLAGAWPSRAGTAAARATAYAAAATASVSARADAASAAVNAAITAVAAARVAAETAADATVDAAAVASDAADAAAHAATDAAKHAATDDVARASRAAARANAAFYKVYSGDAQAVHDGMNTQDLARAPLWPNAMGGMPDELHQQWFSLQNTLTNRDEGWDVWIKWYDARLKGKPRDEKKESAFVTALTEKEWKQEPKAINAKITDILDSIEIKKLDFPTIPKQGIGPKFSIINGLVSFTPASELGEDNTIISRQEALHPQLQRHSRKFVELLEKDNVPRDQVLAAARAYNDLVQRPLPDIQMAQLYGDGLFLQAAINAANNPEQGVNTHPLNADQNIEAEVLTGLHGPFILASEEGQALITDAERYQLTKKDLDRYKDAENQLALQLSNASCVATDEVKHHLKELANITDEDFHPERIETYRKSVINNITIPLIGAVIIGVVAIAPIATALMTLAASVLGSKVIENSEIAKQGSKALANKIDQATIQFVAKNEALLRNVAGDRAHMKFIHQTLDWFRAHKESTDEHKNNTDSTND